MFVRFREERGIAMVMALLVAFVVLLLGTAVLSMAVHNSEQSGMDRKRVQSVSAAEAGLNEAYSYLTSPPGGIGAMSSTLTGTIGSGPGGSTYAVTLTYYSSPDGDPDTEIPPPFSGSNYPRSVLISSVGTTNGKTDRTMESFVELTAVVTGFDGAIMTNSNTTFTNRFTVNGYLGDDGNVYILNGDFSAPSGLENIRGNIYVPQGSASVTTQVHVYGTVWANTSVALGHPQVLVDQDLKSTTSSITVTTGSASGKGYYCTTVTGAGSIAGGTQKTCELGPPPSQVFPQIKYVPTDWLNNDPPYTIQTFTGATACTSARDYIQNTGAYAGSGFSGRNVGSTVVYINATCVLEMSNNATITLNDNLAIITRGSVNLAQQSTWNGVTGTKYIHVISAYPDASTPSCPTQNILFGNLTNFDSHVGTIVYSPCAVTMNNNNTAFQGQVIGQSVSIGNNFTMNFLPVKVPGQNPVGFDQDIAYIREVIT